MFHKVSPSALVNQPIDFKTWHKKASTEASKLCNLSIRYFDRGFLAHSGFQFCQGTALLEWYKDCAQKYTIGFVCLSHLQSHQLETWASDKTPGLTRQGLCNLPSGCFNNSDHSCHRETLKNKTAFVCCPLIALLPFCLCIIFQSCKGLSFITVIWYQSCKNFLLTEIRYFSLPVL